MVITTYACPLCQRTYSQMENAEKGEVCCSRSKSAEISILSLNQRVYNILIKSGIDTIQKVLGKSDSDLLKLKGFGRSSLDDLHQKLQAFVGHNGDNDQLLNC